jgi:hypothetical protein
VAAARPLNTALGLMKIVLVIFILTIQSSYVENKEVEATEAAFDTIQFVASENGAWRVKTFALDQDVHTWSIRATPESIVELARSNTEKHYGDVLAQGYVIETDEGLEGLRAALKQRGLSGHLEVAKTGPLFWALDGTYCRSKSAPRE